MYKERRWNAVVFEYVEENASHSHGQFQCPFMVKITSLLLYYPTLEEALI